MGGVDFRFSQTIAITEIEESKIDYAKTALLMKKKSPPKIKNSVQVDMRATELVSQLALDVKISQMSQLAAPGGRLPKKLRGALHDGRTGSVKLIAKK